MTQNDNDDDKYHNGNKFNKIMMITVMIIMVLWTLDNMS